MVFRTLLVWVGVLLIGKGLKAQDFFSYSGSNYSGLQQIWANPAAAADNRISSEMLVFGLDFRYSSSWLGIKREALQHQGSLFNPSTLKYPASWTNFTPNVPDNLFKNFIPLKHSKTSSLLLENRIWLPSFMMELDDKQGIAFSWSVRQYLNLDGISPTISNLFEKEFDLSVTQDNVIQNKNLHFTQMSWAEYGATYARVLKDKHAHFLKAGITPKILQGLESAYLLVNNLDFLFSTKDTLSYFNTDIAYAHSANLGSPFTNGTPIADFYHYVTKPSLGIDLGFVYEWRPQHQSFKYKPDGTKLKWRKDLNKYKLKFSASLVDLGKIKFVKQGRYYDLNVRLKRNNFNKYTEVKNVTMFDSLLNAEFGSSLSSPYFTMRLPTAIHTQVDYALIPHVYLNLSAHIGNLFKNYATRVHNYTSVSFAPRYESVWFDAALPITYQRQAAQNGQYATVGLHLRLGLLSIGTSDLKPLLSGDIHHYNFYALLKLPVFQKRIRDRDGDGVMDKEDVCVDEAGEPSLKGCKDSDHDQIPDYEDLCPHQPGIALFKGCPDTDGDGVKDAEDHCPKEKGLVYLHGCPDADHDSIPDKEDACTDKAGLRKFKGCPDTDLDGIPDKDDACPTKKGLAKFKGCVDSDNDGLHDGVDQCVNQSGPTENKGCPWPDTDKDGIPDKQDSCVNTPGVLAYKGCPEPVVLETREQRILEKAYDNLEFESGKDKIKTRSYPSLTALATLLVEHGETWKIKLSGHTDKSGDEESNLILSEKRATAVKNYLIKKGVAEDNILVEWYGQTKEIADNSTAEGRQKNRRVEMVVMFKN